MRRWTEEYMSYVIPTMFILLTFGKRHKLVRKSRIIMAVGLRDSDIEYCFLVALSLDIYVDFCLPSVTTESQARFCGKRPLVGLINLLDKMSIYIYIYVNINI